MNSNLDDTICAISSPMGEGGIAIVRMSGPAAHSILATIFRPKKPAKPPFISRRLYLGFIFDPQTGIDVDEVFVVAMAAPYTYTREKIAEVYAHGGLSAQKQILMLMVRNGARIAEPGEFTKRAFLNGRIDLAQAESVLDIIESESDKELEYAMMHAKGMLSERINHLKENIKGLLAEVEARIDFPDEEFEIGEEDWVSRFRTIRGQLSRIISTYAEGRALRHGLEVLIVGRTNVGKSSLLNALVLKERAIVTPIPGTTRDLVDDMIQVRGVKFKVTDTAGLRTPTDAVEKEGIDRVRKRIPEADILLWVLDSSEPYTAEDEDVYEAVKGRKVIAVLNKTDLPAKLEKRSITSKRLACVPVSALHGLGLDSLRDRLYDLYDGMGHKHSGLLLTNLRHRNALAKTEEALQRAEHCSAGSEPVEFLAFELRDALFRLGEITGETCSEEILADIFSRFCIGK